mmetsp:Transcript_27604/g.60766  ORF Transcript_27604/g.60766 Transcript_27604/m.60766 type:complete len:496 (+) Transcript_27604:123-1610(+)
MSSSRYVVSRLMPDWLSWTEGSVGRETTGQSPLTGLTLPPTKRMDSAPVPLCWASALTTALAPRIPASGGRAPRSPAPDGESSTVLKTSRGSSGPRYGCFGMSWRISPQSTSGMTVRESTSGAVDQASFQSPKSSSGNSPFWVHAAEPASQGASASRSSTVVTMAPRCSLVIGTKPRFVPAVSRSMRAFSRARSAAAASAAATGSPSPRTMRPTAWARRRMRSTCSGLRTRSGRSTGDVWPPGRRRHSIWSSGRARAAPSAAGAARSASAASRAASRAPLIQGVSSIASLPNCTMTVRAWAYSVRRRAAISSLAGKNSRTPTATSPRIGPTCETSCETRPFGPPRASSVGRPSDRAASWIAEIPSRRRPSSRAATTPSRSCSASALASSGGGGGSGTGIASVTGRWLKDTRTLPARPRACGFAPMRAVTRAPREWPTPNTGSPSFTACAPSSSARATSNFPLASSAAASWLKAVLYGVATTTAPVSDTISSSRRR